MLRASAQIMFWLSASLLVYVYGGYLLLMSLVGRPRRRHNSPEQPFPSVTLLISAYNESGVIEQKILNSLKLDYPPRLLQIVVISDCSDDGTDEIIKSFAPEGILLVRQTERRGKSSGLNLGVQAAKGDILVFSDANALYRPDAVRCLVTRFGDRTIGYVVGNARYFDSNEQTSSANSEGLYWKIESWLKERESNFGSVVGGDGALYAIRRELYEPLRAKDINDLLNPLQIILKGYRGVYEPTAVSYEAAGDSFRKEFRRKVRIVSRSFNAVRRAWPVLLPWNQFRHWLCLVSHKVLRWMAPFFLVLLAISTSLLWADTLCRIALITQICLYTLALIGFLAQGRGPRLVYLPYYFCVVNLASMLGILKAFSGSVSPTWQTVRQDNAMTGKDPEPAMKRGS